jgi:predicted nucleic acid-binding protein
MIDTNVLVYSTISSSPWHQEARQRLTALVDKGVELCLTPQVAREYLVVLTRGDIFEKRFTADEALGELEAILPAFALLDETEETLYCLRSLVQRYQVRGKAVHDANIVATMLAHGVIRLMTYNCDDFRRFQEITIEPT